MAKRKYRIIQSDKNLYYLQEQYVYLWFKYWNTITTGNSFDDDHPMRFDSLSAAKTALYDYATGETLAKVVYEVEYDN